MLPSCLIRLLSLITNNLQLNIIAPNAPLMHEAAIVGGAHALILVLAGQIVFPDS